MPTPITDEQLFEYAERAEGKVVVITGASQTHVLWDQRTHRVLQAALVALGDKPH
jgi:hypothetical protein